VRALAANGLVFAIGTSGDNRPLLYYVVDAHTGATREVPEDFAAINSQGVLAGLRRAASSDTCALEVYLLFPDGSTKDLGKPAEARCLEDLIFVAGLNDQLQVAVSWEDINGTHPYLWNGTTWQLQARPGSSAVLVALNANGHTAGWVRSNPEHATLWRGSMATDLGVGRAWSLNALDTVVGEQDGAATVWSTSGVRRVPMLPGRDASTAYSVGDSGDVGGEMVTVATYAQHGFLWSNGTVHDVNDLLDSHELLVMWISFIAKDGTIAGHAVDMNGDTQGFVATRTGAPLVPNTAWRDRGTVLARGQGAVALAIDRESVFWMNTSWMNGGWAVRKVSKYGGPAATLAEGAAPEHSEGAIEVGGGYVYLRTFCDQPCTTTGTRRVSSSGGPVETITSAVGEFAVDDRYLYYRTDESLFRRPHQGSVEVLLDAVSGSGIGTDGSDVWYGVTSNDSVTIRRIHGDGGISKQLFDPMMSYSSIGSVKVDASHVYFEARGRMSHGAFRIPRDGGKPELVAPGGAWGFDVSASHIFWAAQRCLNRTALDGSAGACIDTGPFDYRSPRADDTAVYVIRDVDIVRIAR
jgi:hypothetical protein